MKKLLLVTLALSLSAAQVMRADDNDRKKNRRQADSAAEARPQRSAPARQAVRQPVRQPQRVQQQAQRRVVPNQRNLSRMSRAVAPNQQRQAVRSEAQLEGRNRSGVQPSNRAVTPNRNGNRNDTKVTTRGDRGNRNVNRGGNRDFNRNSFHVARSNVIRTPHNRNWWHSHYNTTFILFGGGYYYWWDNYWYPAYGYSPYYNTYLYSEPIYGYDNLAPGQVIENVQLALRDEGYYNGAIDGLIGPQTRAALGDLSAGSRPGRDGGGGRADPGHARFGLTRVHLPTERRAETSVPRGVLFFRSNGMAFPCGRERAGQ